MKLAIITNEQKESWEVVQNVFVVPDDFCYKIAYETYEGSRERSFEDWMRVRYDVDIEYETIDVSEL